MNAYTESLLWLAICGVGILFGLPNLLNALDVMAGQRAAGINGLRSLIVRGHVRTAGLRLIELCCLGAIALPTVTPLRWARWVPVVLLFVAVGAIALGSVNDWWDRRLVASGKLHE